MGQQAQEPAKEAASYAWPVAVRDRQPARRRAEARAVARTARLERRRAGRAAAAVHEHGCARVLRAGERHRHRRAAHLGDGRDRRARRARRSRSRRPTPSPVWRVSSSCTASGNNYLPLDLTHVEGTNEWIGAVAGVSNPHFIAQSVDAAGNIGTTSNKAVLHEANGQGAEFGIIFDGPVGDNDWYTATPDAILIGDIDPATVGVTVNGGPSVPFSQFASARGRRHLRRRRVDRLDDVRGHGEGRPHRADDHHEPGDHDLDGVPGRSGGDARGQLRRSGRAEQFRRGELCADQRHARHVVAGDAIVHGDAPPTTPGTCERRRSPMSLRVRTSTRTCSRTRIASTSCARVGTSP